jgi:8-oxo-dGTP pyrophosphatase MutT (NUDIX family)
MSAFTIVPIARLDLRFAPKPWRFAVERRADIEAHFAALRRDKPAIWNGRVLLLSEYRISGDTFSGSYLETDFASFISWRDWRWPDATMHNCFALAALRAADGAFLVGVMGAHTANAGMIYFPGGTPDPHDIVGGNVDLGSSVMRELAEETGLTADDVDIERGWQTVLAGRRIAMMKVMRARLPAAELRDRVRAYLGRQAEPELADMRIVRGPADLDPLMPEFLTAFLRHMWSTASEQRMVR